VIILQTVPAVDQRTNSPRLLQRLSAEVLAMNGILKPTMVLAIAPARFPAMDRMMETVRVLVMAVRRLLPWIESRISKFSGDGFCYSLCGKSDASIG